VCIADDRGSDLHYLLRAAGFIAVDVVRNAFSIADDLHDGYRFEFSIDAKHRERRRQDRAVCSGGGRMKYNLAALIPPCDDDVYVYRARLKRVVDGGFAPWIITICRANMRISEKTKVALF